MTMTMITAALLAAQVPAIAPADQNSSDARCLIVTVMLAGGDNAELKAAGLIASQYYLGRLDGRSPGLDLKALLTREAERITQAEQGPLLVSCGAAMQKRGEALEAVGERMAKKAR